MLASRAAAKAEPVEPMPMLGGRLAGKVQQTCLVCACRALQSATQGCGHDGCFGLCWLGVRLAVHG